MAIVPEVTAMACCERRNAALENDGLPRSHTARSLVATLWKSQELSEHR